ncbi:glycoside hydrolase family 3 C-terminal domain-containing protein [Deinococcus sp. Leaf326]|uniref:glycoside hydrolase family 3 C-terminal domain-containing protein n=1 Tax=Deinococcus sp. Leaf326 TaxID=1736338 RepID=UPI0006FA35EA|nr:glycoside hydrolase family 3 C-terminal domain-containing protein [Deinococcus sp. Leaf326]KQR04422.1 glycosyl hydrolase family 3 [Deinococcus sp. Leaf326]
MSDVPAPRPGPQPELSLDERLALLEGRDFWHTQPLPGQEAVSMTDGPHGVRRQEGRQTGFNFSALIPATCFPTASALAASWDTELLREVGAALGREARGQGVHVLLGPGVNLKRSPLCGRNFEYFSEDPLLAGTLAAAYIAGLQGKGVGASLKHFAANNQEYRRLSSDSVVDERALRELYLRPFEIAVKEAQPWTVMAAYNGVNGRYCSEHPRLLTKILRDEWGFGGAVISDWGAVNDRARGLRAGLDLEMPGYDGARVPELRAALAAGRITRADVERSVARLRDLAGRAGRTPRTPPVDPDAQHALARRAAAAGVVLLQNTDAALPLRPGAKVAVLGAFAEKPRYQGAGSSVIQPTRLDTPLGELRALLGEENVTYAPGYPRQGEEDAARLREEALALVRDADVVVIVAGLPENLEAEGVDRDHLDLPETHGALIRAVAAAHPRVVVALQSGAPVRLPWRGEVAGIVQAYLGGQAGGGGLADVLTGRVNPGGKLAESFPDALEDVACSAYYPGGPRTAEYRESLYVGYRYHDTAGVEVAFPFGHGLSYTAFGYGTPRLDRGRVGRGEPLTVTLPVTNTGAVAGAEVVQLYVHAPQGPLFRPEQELRAFARVVLAPGETREVTLTLDERAWAVYDVTRPGWHVPGGTYELRLGSSSRDLRARVTVEVAGDGDLRPEPEAVRAVYGRPAHPFRAPDAAFRALYGAPLPDNSPYTPAEYDLNTPLGALQGTVQGRALNALVRLGTEPRGERRYSADAVSAAGAIREMPLRQLYLGTGGRLRPRVIASVTEALAGRWGGALRALVTPDAEPPLAGEARKEG